MTFKEKKILKKIQELLFKLAENNKAISESKITEFANSLHNNEKVKHHDSI